MCNTSPPKRKLKIEFYTAIKIYLKKKIVLHIRTTSPEFLNNSGFEITSKHRNRLIMPIPLCWFGLG